MGRVARDNRPVAEWLQDFLGFRPAKTWPAEFRLRSRDQACRSWRQQKPPAAMFNAVVKTIALLAILFVMLYVGMNNTHAVDFHFPVAGTTTKSPIHASAALIYFGVFAVGVLAGTIMWVGGRGHGGRRAAPKDK